MLRHTKLSPSFSLLLALQPYHPHHPYCIGLYRISPMMPPRYHQHPLPHQNHVIVFSPIRLQYRSYLRQQRFITVTDIFSRRVLGDAHQSMLVRYRFLGSNPPLSRLHRVSPQLKDVLRRPRKDLHVLVALTGSCLGTAIVDRHHLLPLPSQMLQNRPSSPQVVQVQIILLLFVLRRVQYVHWTEDAVLVQLKCMRGSDAA